MKEMTAAQLRKMKCCRCEKQAEYQWSACADNNVWRPLCAQCDFDLNVLVMQWYGFRGWVGKARAYAKLLNLKWSGPTKSKES